MSITRSSEETNLFGSGTIWVITCVLVTIFPTLCSCIFSFITENETLNYSIFFSKYLLPHLKDILLITFSISCSLLALSLDKSKYINNIVKKIGIIVSILAGAVSGFYYFYIDGRNDSYVNNNHLIIYFYIFSIVVCSIIGFLIGSQHDKKSKQCASSNNK